MQGGGARGARAIFCSFLVKDPSNLNISARRSENPLFHHSWIRPWPRRRRRHLTVVVVVSNLVQTNENPYLALRM